MPRGPRCLWILDASVSVTGKMVFYRALEVKIVCQ